MAESNDLSQAFNSLNDRNRVLLEARMLSKTKPLTAEQTGQVIEQFNAYIAPREIRLARVAREIGKSESVISQWRTGNYGGDVDGITRLVNEWMERSRRREEASRPRDFVSTFVATVIQSAVHQADKLGCMAVIVSPAGSGKTKTSLALCDELHGLYIAADPSCTPRNFLLKLGSELGRKTAKGTVGEILRYIVGALSGTKRLIIIDEAHQLPQNAIGFVRAIHDNAAVPIVMLGTADILKFVDDRTDGRGQFSSRCLTVNLIEDIANAESPDGNRAGRDLFTIDEIKQFFATRKIRLADDGLRLLWGIACLPNHGTLRLISFVADMAADVNSGEAVLTRQQLLEALQLFVGGARARYLRGLVDRQEGAHRAAKVA